MKIVTSISIFLILAFSPITYASIFGEENIVLAQILANAVSQLAQLKQMLSTGKDTLGLLKDINQGINDSLGLYRTTFPNSDPGIYNDWLKVQEAMGKLEIIYGAAGVSPDQTVQQNVDQSVVEAVTLNNSIYEYSRRIDVIGEQVKDYSHSVSPGGAQKLTAETLGVMLHVMNQSLRAQATGLKLQAQSMAAQNRRDKEWSKQLLSNSEDLKSAMKSGTTPFQLPRF